MNLPAIATEFLDAFIGLYRRYVEQQQKKTTGDSSTTPHMPRIHVYAFSTDPDQPIHDIVYRIAGTIHCDPSLIESSVGFQGHVVRDVAPRKVMVCISFTLPQEVAMAKDKDNNNEKEITLPLKRSAADMEK
jgi:tRNA (guanine37-N1)-methyltransferase